MKGVTIIINGTITDCVNPLTEALSNSMYKNTLKFNIKGANSSARYVGVINLGDCTEISNLNIDGWLYFNGINRVRDVTFTDGTRGSAPIQGKNASIEFNGNIKISSNSYGAIQPGYGDANAKIVFSNTNATITSTVQAAFQVTSYAERVEIKDGSNVTVISPKSVTNSGYLVESGSTLKVRGAALHDVKVYGQYYYDSTGDASSTSYISPDVYNGGIYVTNRLEGNLRVQTLENVYACKQSGAMLYGHKPGSIVGTYKCYAYNNAQKVSDTPSIAMPNF